MTPETFEEWEQRMLAEARADRVRRLARFKADIVESRARGHDPKASTFPPVLEVLAEVRGMDRATRRRYLASLMQPAMRDRF